MTWFLCVDKDAKRRYIVRAKNATKAKEILYSMGYTDAVRYPSGVTPMSCTQIKALDVIPLFFDYCFVTGSYLFCRDKNEVVEIVIPLKEVEKALGMG